MNQEHELKAWPSFYDDVASGRKPFEVRKNDRGFQVGDTLRLRRFNPATGEYTGEECMRRVTYVLHGGCFGLAEGYVVLGFDVATEVRAEGFRAAKEKAAGIADAEAKTWGNAKPVVAARSIADKVRAMQDDGGEQ
jgi:hypothetical protein